ncbi:hypothetical protein G5B37_06595 [Rasiella rasia]|uniref:DUF5723 domain-containing protein n=1 Tax=Rasiella rasia TaxID=2744027 RepID=A0A6G6GNG6_9FLAO|nr:DUF5723 family protein [Rasiella rasia]QIE59241.1 hypothetical protein G5B37_06595 [Rasiella rasia]
MKNYCFFIVALWVCTSFAQNKQVLYGLTEAPQNLMLNPGSKVPYKKHFGIPLFSQIHINGGSSGVSAYDIFQESDIDINTRIRNKIFELENTDFFTATQQLEILSFGWRSKNDIYFSGGVYQEFDFITYFPRDLAILAWEGNRDYLDYPFNLGELSLTADLLTVYHFGANKQLTDKLTLGLRAKVYSSMISFSSTDNQGTFTTSLDTDGVNIYDHTIADANVTVNTSGVASLRDRDGAGDVSGDILGRAFFGGNLGVGVDIGATYDVTNRITASASVLDLGAIFHTKDIESYQATGDYTLNGIELIFPPLGDGEPTLPYYDNLEDELENEIPIDTITSGYTQWRPLKINASVEYGFGNSIGGECDCTNPGGGVTWQQAIGAQFYSIFRPKGPQMAGTVYYRRKFTETLSAKATYTVDPYSTSNVGLGVVADIGKFNLFVAADNLLRYGNLAKAKSVSLQLGLNIKIDER